MTEELDDLTVDADYLKGFNEGYFLSEAMPELAARLENLDLSKDELEKEDLDLEYE